MRKKLHPAGTLIEHRDGTRRKVFLVYDFEADPEQPWETICERHGTVCSHRTRALARWFMVTPEAWCEDCEMEID